VSPKQTTTIQIVPCFEVHLASDFGPGLMVRRPTLNSAATFNATFQAIASLLTFVAFFLALVLCTIMCLVAAELISGHASVVRDYGVRPVSSNTRVVQQNVQPRP